jgi:hypothetical protein
MPKTCAPSTAAVRSRRPTARCKRTVALLAASLLLAAVAAPAPAADAAAPAPAVPSPTVTSIPAPVQPLVAKIEQLPVNSERYSETTHADGTLTVKVHGKRRKETKHLTKVLFGEASLAPLVGKTFRKGQSGPLSTIVIGSTLYSYSPSIARKDGGRPWVRLTGLGSGGLFPFHGGLAPRVEVSAGGTGSYAELIDLLATADGNVKVVGPATVDGQPTTELTAAVNPLALLKGGSPKEIQSVTEALTVFVAESGLPVRVIRSTHLGPIALTETTDVLALNVPVAVKAPPKDKTIGEAKLMKLEGGKGKGGEGSGEGGTGFKL